ncbi:MAG: tRNA (adenosine(37)-N6)-threonylcarbamoyltransferase complex ATPase subunit type 1 TsaE [Clostridiaceae bacterium]|nr:tRNA (adenosine(37)-N6)-threonylcarbamoyltransferase complex ATPase subunit type 1 TsaE [Clostridiaceae bacterium]
MTHRTRSPQETFELGVSLASSFLPGDVVILTGSLGAGKTALIHGIASAMEVKSHVSSPTFTLLHIHLPIREGGIALHHFDLYRLEDADDFTASGLDEYVGGDWVSALEWGDRARVALPKEVIEIDIRYGQGPQERLFTIRFPEGRKLESTGRSRP